MNDESKNADDVRALIEEARQWPRDGVNEGPLIHALADALEVRLRGPVTYVLAQAWDEGFSLATRNNPNRPHPMAGMNPYRNGEIRPRGTVTDEYEAGYGEGFHHGRSTPTEHPITDAEVEAAAKAIFNLDDSWTERSQSIWDAMREDARAIFRRSSRAALEAAREVQR